MMQRCSSSSSHGHGNMVGGPCSCGYFHQGNCSSSFSMLFHKPYDYDHHYDSDTHLNHHDNMYAFASSSSSSPSVDCTLSLGTPSTRSSSTSIYNNHDQPPHPHHERRSSSTNNCMSNFCWDILQPHKTTHTSSSSSSKTHHHHHRGSNNGTDPLVARRCANCDTTSTPLWRNGPRGPKSLCNACGIRFKKEERRAAATNGGGGGGAAAGVEAQHTINSSWAHHSSSSQGQRMACLSSSAYGNEFRFIEDDDERDNAETAIPFLSWRLNVTDRPSLVHDFTR